MTERADITTERVDDIPLLVAQMCRMGRKRQDSERNRAVTCVSPRWPLHDVAYAASSTAHTSLHRSTKSRR